MSDQALREALRELPLPGEDGACERGWRVVAAVARERAPQRRRRLRLRHALVVAVLLAVVPAALALPGVGLGRRLLHSLQAPATPAQRGLPVPGRLLAVSRAGTFVVRADGSLRRLGAFGGAWWSPHGLNVLARSGTELQALAPWSAVQRWPHPLGTQEPISQAAWSRGDGWRVAYVAGRRLRVANGDGSGDHAVATAGRPIALAWRPLSGHAHHELALATAGGSLALVDVDAATHARWRVRLAARAAQLDWSADGRRLAVLLGDGRVELRDARGRLLQRLTLAARRLAFAPSGRHLAAVVHAPGSGRSALVLLTAAGPRVLFAAPGPLSSLAWSPDGRVLLVAAPRSDAWVFVPLHGGRVTYAQPASRLYGGGAFPQVAGWVAPPRGRAPHTIS